ncbi:MAG: hypothetical protein U0Q55_18745 [Vicinamibacterales bacterium]
MSQPEENKENEAADAQTITKGLKRLSHILKLREDFLADLLLDKDDWSFVVKSHALLEAAVCALLVVHLRKHELDEVLSEQVEMSARIEMTKALGLTTDADRKAMRALSNLRNRLVHNAKDTNFRFVEHFKNKDVRRNFSDTFGHAWPDPVPGTDPSTSRSDYVIANPKLAIFQSVTGIALHVVSEMAKIQDELMVQSLQSAILGHKRSPDAAQ